MSLQHSGLKQRIVDIPIYCKQGLTKQQGFWKRLTLKSQTQGTKPTLPSSQIGKKKKIAPLLPVHLLLNALVNALLSTIISWSVVIKATVPVTRLLCLACIMKNTTNSHQSIKTHHKVTQTSPRAGAFLSLNRFHALKGSLCRNSDRASWPPC